MYNRFGIVTISNTTFCGNSARGTPSYDLTGGANGSGGAIYNRGNLTVSLTTFLTNAAVGGDTLWGVYSGEPVGNARGGAIYNLGTCLLNSDSFLGNCASGGTGGQGGSSVYVGMPGYVGGQASGGAIYQAGNRLTVLASTFASNYVTGGVGGLGGRGLPDHGSLGRGGDGGTGGDGLGAGICAAGGLVCATNNSFANNQAQGGNGGYGGCGADGCGTSGNGGNAYAGAFYVSNATVYCVNNTLHSNTATGAAISIPGLSFNPVGNARGGAIYNLGTCWLSGNSLLHNGASGGNGPAGNAARSDGADGAQAAGGGIYQGSNTLTVLGCTFGSNYVAGGAGGVAWKSTVGTIIMSIRW